MGSRERENVDVDALGVEDVSETEVVITSTGWCPSKRDFLRACGWSEPSAKSERARGEDMCGEEEEAVREVSKTVPSHKMRWNSRTKAWFSAR